MFTGIALMRSEVPVELREAHRLQPVVRLGGEPEVWFLWSHRPRVLPVWLDGRLDLVRWGTRRGESRWLPVTGWASLESLEAGRWSRFDPQRMDIPANLLRDNGRWTLVRQGIRALLVREDGVPVVYPLVEPSTRYYRVMTRSEWMPVLVGEVI